MIVKREKQVCVPANKAKFEKRQLGPGGNPPHKKDIGYMENILAFSS